MANSEIILFQFFALIIPLATKIPFDPNSAALETSSPETIPAPQRSFVLLFASFTAFAAFVINSGGDNLSDYDSTVVAIDLKDGVVPINNFAGNMITGKNPSSVLNDENIIVLCTGIYDESNMSNNEESSFSRIGAGNLNVISNTVLNGIYNADNLCVNESDTRFYFTASDGVYWSDKSSFNTHLVTNKKVPNVLISNNETYFDVTDSIYKTVNYLWCNDQNNPNYLYKINFQSSEIEDSIMLDSPIIDLEIYR